MSTTRRKFSNEFKTKVVLESLKERETLESLAKKYELLPTQISAWKAQALQNFGQVFTSDKPDKKENAVDIDKLYSQIGQLKVENDFLKKKLQ
jgi:transposase-like protein